VGLEIAPQVFAATEEVELLAPVVTSPPLVNPAALDQAVQLLARTEKPVIWAGGGVQRADAWATLQALAEQLQAPVVTSRQGKGVLSDQHPLALGFAETRYPPLRDWLAQAQVDGQPWNKTAPAPALPPEVVQATAERYQAAARALLGA
jgi:thiamine pyrophosphate-dependent acetolactate synthase large subunit-like protein